MESNSNGGSSQPIKQRIIRGIRDYLVGQFHIAPRATFFRRLKIAGTSALVLIALWLIGYAGVHAWGSLSSKLAEPYWFQEPVKDSPGLVVVVHGWTKGPADMEQVAEVVTQHPDYERHAVFLWAYDSSVFSNKNPEGLAQDLALKIRELHGQVPGDIVLMGHSLGGLLVRRAYLTGLKNEEAWSKNVDRLILLAAPNRGTEATSRSPWLWLQDAMARSFAVGKLIRSTYRGSPFVVNLRIDWIRRFQRLENRPLVAQIVGRKDHVVSSSDSIDILQFPNSITRELSNSTHASIINATESGPYIQEILGKERRGSTQVIAPSSDSVFKLLVVHGIRDYGGRFDEIEDEVKFHAREQNLKPVASSPRYRYFSALQFINPFSRQHKVYEFADLYAEMLATPPVDAPIHFIGHSFGTYLMGKSAKTYAAIEFERVYLAGSVLAENFFSEKGVLGDRIKYVRNDIATKDWPVGILCSGIARLGLADDIGTGGFNGFTQIVGGSHDEINELRYFDGGHGKALERVNRSSIASWLLQDSGAPFNLEEVKASLREAEVLINDRSYLWGFVSRVAPALFVGVLVLIIYLVFFGRQPLFAASEILIVMWLLNII